VSPAEALSELTCLLNENPRPFPLDRAALLLAVDEYPALDLRRCEAQLDGYARRVEARAAAADPAIGEPRRRLSALLRVLFEDEGFKGNRETYYDVRNSYLNEVLDRKLGIPISLATVVLGVARRLGWPLHGINFPFHFLVRYDAPGEALAIDPFDGLILSEDELLERWRLSTRSEPPSLEQILAPADPHAVLLRMLNNIRGVHVRQRYYASAALATEKMALIEPEVPQHQRDLGYFLAGAGDFWASARHLEDYLARAPHAGDAEQVRTHLHEIRERMRDPGNNSG
jgi:regulator of sirC expression with transglutaminase-like and TPR domain